MTGEERLLVVLNENPPGSHGDVHFALAELVREGRLGDYAVYPHRARTAEGLDSQAVCDEIEAMAGSFRPTQILWSHTLDLVVAPPVVMRLRQTPDRPSLGYWEGDWFTPFYKPLPRASLALAAGCDVAFLCGEGHLSRMVRRAGCPRLEYVPSVADERFVTMPCPASREFDLVLVANSAQGRRPFRTMPGAVERQRLVSMFERRLGSGFAIFGEGWSGPSAQGPIPLTEQIQVCRRSTIVLGNNNLHAAYFFSNRLAISLMSGRPVIHGWERGLDAVFPTSLALSWFSSPAEAWETFRDAAALTDADAEQEWDNSDFATRQLTTRRALGHMASVLAQVRSSVGQPFDESEHPNPWGVRLPGG